MCLPSLEVRAGPGGATFFTFESPGPGTGLAHGVGAGNTWMNESILRQWISSGLPFCPEDTPGLETEHFLDAW